MPSVAEATDALRVALRKQSVESHVQDAFDNLASCLVLLNSSSPSVLMIQKLCSVLRRPLLPLYNACFQTALQLSSSVLSVVLGKLCDAHNVEDDSSRAAWDATAEVILSGILDFLDQKDGADVEPGGAVWEVLYRIICESFFLDSGRGLPTFSISLFLSAYNTLTEIAARQTTVRNTLRQRAVLGGERLGAAISGTRDYLLLEALLMLFARLLPPTHATPQGKFGRLKFVKEVLGSPKLFKCNAELLDVMQKMTGTHWDDVAAQIIDVLARTDITYPQPFSIDEIDVCGRVFPQPLATDRLIMDRHAFLVNIVAENDDVCESLQVPYSRIRRITLDNSEKNVPKGKVSIMVYLTSPPLVANVEMKPPGASHLHAKFLLQNNAVGRFMEALRRRGVGKLSFLNPLTRVEARRKSISIGSGFQFTNDSSPIPPSASFEGKVQHVNQVYKTEIEDPTTFQGVPLSYVGGADSLPTPGPKSPFKDDIQSIKGPSKPLWNSAASFHPGKSTRTKHLFDDTDELSEISDFEFDDDTPNERVENKASASCNHGAKSTQHRTDEKSNITSNGMKTSPESILKISGHTEGIAQRSLGARKPLLTSDSPMFGPSSSTQIDVSPELLWNADTLFTTADTEVVDGLPSASLDLVGADMLKKKDADECGVFDAELVVASVGTPQIRASSAKDGLGQHARRLTPSSGSNQKTRSGIEITKDTNVPPKIAGSRRKRESAKTSTKPIIEIDDECTPPSKKRREDRLGIEEDKAKYDETLLDVIPASRVKRNTKTAKRSSPCIDPTAVNFDELVELKPTCQGARRSSRIRKRQGAAKGGTRPNVTRGKTQKGKQADDQSACGVERKKLATVSPQDPCIGVDHGTSPILSSCPIPLVKDSPATKMDNQTLLMGPRSAENISPETNLSRGIPQDSNNLACTPRQLNVTPGKEPQGNLDFVQEAASHAMQLVQEQVHIKTEEIIDRTMDTEASQVREVAEYSVSLKESERPVEPFRPTMESTPRETVTIDLTIDDSPAQEQSELHKTSVGPVHSEANLQTKLRTPEQSDSIAIGELASVPSPRRRRRSVTFASPIEYVLEKKVKSRTHVGSPMLVAYSSWAGTKGEHVDGPSSINAARSHRTPSPPESNTISPLRIPIRTVGVRRESSGPIISRVPLQNSKLLQASGSVLDQTVDENDIHDIVEVLNEIQAVIIKGISDKFRNVRKDVQHSRDELIQQALDELRGMVVENAKYFNGLLRLEEDYHKHCKTLTCCWEELIDCNDSVAVHFQNALKEHDKNISVKAFPKSLVPLQSVFPRHRSTQSAN